MSSAPASHHVAVIADYGQFYLQDLAAYTHWLQSDGMADYFSPGGWTPEANDLYRIGVEPHSIAVGTARIDLVEVVLHLHHREPPPNLEPADHVVEADLNLPGGNLAIFGPTVDPGTEQQLTIAPGYYRARVSYLPSEPPEGADEDVSGAHFCYVIDLWMPGEPKALDVLKQGLFPWAG